MDIKLSHAAIRFRFKRHKAFYFIFLRVDIVLSKLVLTTGHRGTYFQGCVFACPKGIFAGTVAKSGKNLAKMVITGKNWQIFS